MTKQRYRADWVEESGPANAIKHASLTSVTANVMSEKQKNEHPVGLPDAAAESLKNGNFREASALLLAHAREQA
jgi:hypothetical protein